VLFFEAIENGSSTHSVRRV